jgi:hypothetical protein
LFKEGADVYYLLGLERCLKKKLSFNPDYLFEAQPSIAEESDSSEVTLASK